jgi:23S rRNA pseudouridine1911/1915/1917 synthase
MSSLQITREPKIIYENDNFMAIEKPAGLMVHPARVAASKVRSGPAEPTLVDWLLAHRPEVAQVGDDPATRPGIVHRLDKETSGIMLIPKTQDYFEYLKSLFQKHAIKKTYYAVVRGILKKKEGTIDAPIGIVNGTLRRSTRSKKMAKEAVTKYKVVQESMEDSLLEVYPLTGRTHQIRVHLASIGHPIVGDRLYGSHRKADLAAPRRLMLHAASIEFPERDGHMIRLSTELPFALDG